LRSRTSSKSRGSAHGSSALFAHATGFVYPLFQETTATAIQACEGAVEFFGGVFRVVIPDDTKTIITEADPIAPRITDGFLECAQARGFVIEATRVRHPKDKARVERAVPTSTASSSAASRPRSPPDRGRGPGGAALKLLGLARKVWRAVGSTRVAGLRSTPPWSTFIGSPLSFASEKAAATADRLTLLARSSTGVPIKAPHPAPW
jgi:hypothetical protein